MKIFAFEYATAGGEGGAPFLKEGQAMISALLEDLSALPELEILTLFSPPSHEGKFLNAATKKMELADAVWIIAPETDGMLKMLHETAKTIGKPVIGSEIPAIEICSNKLKLSTILNGKVPYPASRKFSGTSPFPKSIVKPIDGAGCENVFICENGFAPPKGNFLAQEFIDGESFSAGIFSYGGNAEIIGVCREIIVKNGSKLRLERIEGPIEYGRLNRLAELVKEIGRAISGLKGYWGIDFIERNGRPILIEINPRLTLSYSNYRKFSKWNIAGKILESFINSGEVN